MAQLIFSFADVLQSGAGTVNLLIPGTFAGNPPSTLVGTGRMFKQATIWSPNWVDGDALTAMQLVDIDGIVPVPARVAFPNYPVIIDFLDQISGQAKQLSIPSAGVEIDAYDSNGQQTAQFLPGQFYFVLTFASGGGAGRTFRGTIRWGYYQ